MDSKRSESESFGFILSVMHGRKSKLFDTGFYNFLSQSDNVEDVMVKLLGTSYRTELAEGTPISKGALKRSLRRSLKNEVKSVYNESVGDLKILITYFIETYSISNFFYMLNLKAADDSLVDEIGYFQELETLKFSNNMEDVYKFCIEPTFLKNLFDKIQYVNDIKQNNLQIMEAEIRKIHTNTFYMKITHNMDHMKNILKAEGTRYLVELVINSLSSIKGEDRKKFLPQITKFTTGDINALSLASSLDDIKNIIRIDGNEDQILNKLLSKEIDEYLFSFNKFNDISTVYAYFKLKEREIQNILWILECIRHEKKEYAGNIVKVNG